jgi:hypothetical protein
MTLKSGWQLAMQRIDARYDIPQFVASSLIRKIAANNFRLPASERLRFQRIPDDVITHIEHVVREAYLEAGENTTGEAFHEQLWQQALEGRREMVARGELLTPEDFKEQIHTSERQLARLLSEGSVFAIEVDGNHFIPAILARPEYSRKRLEAVCRILVPAPAISRFDFLVSSHGNLSDRSPLQMLNDDDDFKQLQAAATAWASEWSRTFVTLFEGEHDTEPTLEEAIYTVAVEIDPRTTLWERASEALHSGGYQWPPGPYPKSRCFTLFVSRIAPGQSDATQEACVQVVAGDKYIQIRIVTSPGATLQTASYTHGEGSSVTDVAKRVVARLKRKIT